VALSERQGSSTLVLRLWNSAGGPSAKAIWGMPIEARRLYLFGVDLRQDEGSRACAAFAFEPPRPDYPTPDAEWLDCPVSTEAMPWRQVATVLRPRSDSTRLSLLLINYGPGIAEFDNVFLFPLVPPDELLAQAES